jgi:hypothetical protein
MRREDFVFCIGYEGASAIVDGKLKARYGSYSTRRLAEAGLFKQAVCSAIFSEKPEELEEVLQVYNAQAKRSLSSVEELKRTFGISGLPEGVTRLIMV